MPANEKSRNAQADTDLPAAVLARIVERMSPLAIWLFGARARGRARPDSDYDLLAVMPDGTPEDDLDPVKAWAVTRDLGVPVDLIPCTLSEFEEEKNELDTLPREASRHGKLIYEQRA
jgi:predicted nucleotidyltransferase